MLDRRRAPLRWRWQSFRQTQRSRSNPTGFGVIRNAGRPESGAFDRHAGARARSASRTVLSTPSSAPASPPATTIIAAIRCLITSRVVSGTAEFDYSILFASVNAATVQMPNLSHFQMTNTLGIRPAFGPVTVETGVAYYSYPGGASDPSYSEFYVAPSYAATSRLLVGLKLYYAPDYYRMGVWENYNSIAAKYDVGSGLTISAELGHQTFGKTAIVALPNYTYGNIGLSFSYKSLTFDLFYHATTLSKQTCFLITGTGSAIGGSNGCDPAVVATLSWSAGLSEVKGSLAGPR